MIARSPQGVGGESQVDPIARGHRIPGAPVPEDEGGVGELLLLSLDQALTRALAQQLTELVLAVGLVSGLRRRRHSKGFKSSR